MSLVGYPDFQEQAQWQSPVAVAFGGGIGTGVTLTYPVTGPVYFNVNNWQSTQIGVTGAPSLLDVELDWYDAIPATILMGRTLWTSAPGNRSLLTVPNQGPYLQVKVSNNSGAPVASAAIVVAFTNRVAPPWMVPEKTPLILSPLALLGAGATATATGQFTYSGPATFFCRHDSPQNWSAYLYGVNGAGVNTTYAAFGNFSAPTPNVAQTVYVPPEACFLQLTNHGAAGHNFEFGLTPDYSH